MSKGLYRIVSRFEEDDFQDYSSSIQDVKIRSACYVSSLFYRVMYMIKCDYGDDDVMTSHAMSRNFGFLASVKLFEEKMESDDFYFMSMKEKKKVVCQKTFECIQLFFYYNKIGNLYLQRHPTVMSGRYMRKMWSKMLAVPF